MASVHSLNSHAVVDTLSYQGDNFCLPIPTKGIEEIDRRLDKAYSASLKINVDKLVHILLAPITSRTNRRILDMLNCAGGDVGPETFDVGFLVATVLADPRLAHAIPECLRRIRNATAGPIYGASWKPIA